MEALRGKGALLRPQIWPVVELGFTLRTAPLEHFPTSPLSAPSLLSKCICWGRGRPVLGAHIALMSRGFGGWDLPGAWPVLSSLISRSEPNPPLRVCPLNQAGPSCP